MNRFSIQVTFFIVLCLAAALSAASAQNKFRYEFKENTMLHYIMMVNSNIKFEELGSLAQLLNLDNVTNNVEMYVDINVISVGSSGTALVKVNFRKISMVTVAGDSVFTDDGSNWGAIKPGSVYDVEISKYGQILGGAQIDSAGGRQAIQLVQRFFPQFPEQEIDFGHEWSDSLNFELQMPGESATEIQSQMTYLYVSKEPDGSYRFDYEASGSSQDAHQIALKGCGNVIFDNNGGRLSENNGGFNIDAQLNLASLGFPSGLGFIPVHIESTIEIKLKNEE